MSSSQVPYDRTRARREVLQAMYQHELTGTSLSDLLSGEGDTSLLLIPERPKGVEDTELVGVPVADYAGELLSGIGVHLDQIDQWIADTAENWTLERMPIVDRNIIRIAAYEIAFCDDIPTGVAINEAVEVAKAFGGDESPKFVNGVLGRIASMIEEQQADKGEAVEEADASEASGEQPVSDEPVDDGETLSAGPED